MSDYETERARLARLYSKMSDDELAQILGDEKSLTEIAKAVLGAELSSRGITWEPAITDTQPQESPTDDVNVPQHSGPLVMAKRFRDLTEAFVAKSILDSAEIDSFLADENIVRLDWLYSNLVGGAKLMVRPEDLDEAIKLLAEANLAGNESSEVGSNQPGEEHE
jgi:hypothetical protein